MNEQRHLLALRLYVDDLLADGAVVLRRRPLTLLYAGHRMSYACGMLIHEESIEEIELA